MAQHTLSTSHNMEGCGTRDMPKTLRARVSLRNARAYSTFYNKMKAIQAFQIRAKAQAQYGQPEGRDILDINLTYKIY